MAEALRQKEVEQVQVLQTVLEKTLVRVLGLALPGEDAETGIITEPDMDAFVPASFLMSHPAVAQMLHERMTAWVDQSEAVAKDDMTAEEIDDFFDDFDDVFEVGKTAAQQDAMQQQLENIGVQTRVGPVLPQEFLAHFSAAGGEAKGSESESTTISHEEMQEATDAVQLDDLGSMDAFFDAAEQYSTTKPHLSFKAGPRRGKPQMLTPEEAAAAGVVLSAPPPVELSDADIPGEPKSPEED